MDHSAPSAASPPRVRPRVARFGPIVLAGLIVVILVVNRVLLNRDVADLVRPALAPSPGTPPVPGRLDLWLVPALELAAAALIARQALKLGRERRGWLTIAALSMVLMLSHLAYRILMPLSLDGTVSIRPLQLGLGVHLVEAVFFLGCFVALTLLSGPRIGQPTRGVSLDALIAGCGALTLGVALLVPDSVVEVAHGWSEVGAVLVGVAAFAPIALLIGMLPLLGRAPSSLWASTMLGALMLSAATAMTILPLAVGADARGSLGWLLWPSGLLALARTAWHAGFIAPVPNTRLPVGVVSPTLFAAVALIVLAFDEVIDQALPVLILAFLTLLMSLLRMSFALRSAVRQTVHDRIQAQKLVEARDAAIAAVQARSDFLATMSHEIRTPLNAVIGMSDLVLRSRLDVSQREQVEHVRRSGALILELVNDVLDRATIDANQLTLEYRPLELAEVLGDVIELLQVSADAKGIQLRAELDPACPEWVRGDATRLRQVLINLLANAVKFTDRGEVTVEVCPAARLGEPPAIYFQVTDTGTGIPAGEMNRLFKPYSQIVDNGQRRRGGTGLGLSISQTIVHRMGGNIVATSQEGIGSVFGFELVMPEEPIPTAVACCLEDRRLSVVDRRSERADQLVHQLERWGASVIVRSPDQPWWEDRVDTVLIREDHPDALARLAELLAKHPFGHRPTLVLITTSAYAVTTRDLGPSDLMISATTSGSRLRARLMSVGPAALAAEAEAEAEAHLESERPLRILLAEDDPPSRRVCELIVRQLGHQIEAVHDGQAAVEAVRRSAYDLVLMDSQMPVLDGPAATRVIRAEEPAGVRMPIVALTGAVSAADRESHTAAGIDATLAKPISRDALVELLAKTPRRSLPTTVVSR